MSLPPRFELILDTLGSALVNGRIPAGTTLTLQQIQDDYRVSRTVARECVRTLESMRLVDSARRTGIRVRTSSEWNLFDRQIIRWRLNSPARSEQLLALTELRIAVEPAAGFYAALRATPGQRAKITGLARTMDSALRADDVQTYFDTDILFHKLLLEASGNQMFLTLTEAIVEALAESPRSQHGHVAGSEAALALHIVVASAVADADAQRAESAMRQIVREVQDLHTIGRGG